MDGNSWVLERIESDLYPDHRRLAQERNSLWTNVVSTAHTARWRYGGRPSVVWP